MFIGYARISTQDQTLALQQDALEKANCEQIFTDKVSGIKAERKGLTEALSHLRWTCVGSVDCLRLRTVRGKENIATNKPDLPTGVSPRSYPAG
jgi:predicted site-specific integrase-resolvase